jgi:hypothetical protein
MSDATNMTELETKLDKHIETHARDYEDMRRTLSSIWWKIAGILAIPIITGLIGYGRITADVTHLQNDVVVKANRETVETQLASLNTAMQYLIQRFDQALPEIKTKK